MLARRGVVLRRQLQASRNVRPAAARALHAAPTAQEGGPSNSNTLLFIGAVWPEPTTTAAGIRSLNVINTFRDAGWKVVAGAPSAVNMHAERLQALGVDTRPIYPNDPAADALLTELQPDVVVFDRFTTEEKFGWRVAEAAPSALRVLDTQDLHFLRSARQVAVKAGATLAHLSAASLAALRPLPPLVGPGGVGAAAAAAAAGVAVGGSVGDGEGAGTVELVSEEALRELAAILRCDLSLIISSYELQLLQAHFGIPPELLLLNRFHYPPPPAPANPPFEARAHLAMIGHFRHAPNVDGLLWFRDRVWPEVRRKLPEAAVHVYGAYPTKEHMALGRRDRAFVVKGPCVDQYEMLRRYRVNLAPLRFGAGIKGKICDGWWAGTPVVTTTIGAEGMHDEYWDCPDGSLAGSVPSAARDFPEPTTCRQATNSTSSSITSSGSTSSSTIGISSIISSNNLLSGIGDAGGAGATGNSPTTGAQAAPATLASGGRRGCGRGGWQELQFGGHVTDDPREFAEQVMELYSSRDTWERAQQRGYELMARLYDERRNRGELLGGVEWALGQREVVQGRNVVGRMLQHHTMRSTKYFSRWIEEKEARVRAAGEHARLH